MLPPGIVAVRRALLTPRPDLQASTVAELRAGVERAKRLRHSSCYEALGLMLPGLAMAGASAAVHDTPQPWWCLAGSHQVASALSRMVGVGDRALRLDNAATVGGVVGGGAALAGAARPAERLSVGE